MAGRSETLEAAHTAVMLMESIGEARWTIMYDRDGEALGGFPGVARHVAEAAVCFEEIYQAFDKKDEEDYLELIEALATFLVCWSHERITRDLIYNMVCKGTRMHVITLDT